MSPWTQARQPLLTDMFCSIRLHLEMVEAGRLTNDEGLERIRQAIAHYERESHLVGLRILREERGEV